MAMGPISGFHVVGELPSAEGERLRRSARHPDGRAAQVVLGGPGLIREVTRLPRGGPWAQSEWGQTTEGVWVLIPEDREIALPSLRNNAPPLVAFAIALLLLEALSPIHDQNGWHGRFEPSSIGFDRRGRLRILPNLHGARLEDPGGDAPSEALDTWLVGGIMLYLLGNDWPAPPSVPRDLSLEGMDDSRGRLLLSGLLRSRPRFRLSPASAARQGLMAVTQGRSEPEEALRELLDLAGLGQELRHTAEVELPPRAGMGLHRAPGVFPPPMTEVLSPEEPEHLRPMRVRHAIAIPDILPEPPPAASGNGASPPILEPDPEDIAELDDYEYAAEIEDEHSDVVQAEEESKEEDSDDNITRMRRRQHMTIAMMMRIENTRV